MKFKLIFAITLMVIARSWADTFAQNTASFTSELYKKLAEGRDGQNIIVSPFSVHSALTMAYFGASGETAAQMREVLKLAPEYDAVTESYETLFSKKGRSVKVANKIYVQEAVQIKSGFNDLLRETFKSPAENINFANPSGAVSTINDWIRQNTNDKIKDLLSPSSVNPATKAVIVNAVHFKGLWERTLDASNTTKAPFWISETETKEVDMMNAFDFASFGFFDGYTVLEKKYLKGGYSMLFVLPGQKGGLQDLEEKLTGEKIMQLRRGLRFMKVDMKIPKFEVEFGVELGDTLNEMGMTTMFTPSADFSKLTDTPVHVNNVVHKAFIKVDEEGTEATGFSTLTVGMIGFNQKGRFFADHPFIYLIVDRQGHVYFMGRVVNP